MSQHSIFWIELVVPLIFQGFENILVDRLDTPSCQLLNFRSMTTSMRETEPLRPPYGQAEEVMGADLVEQEEENNLAGGLQKQKLAVERKEIVF